MFTWPLSIAFEPSLAVVILTAVQLESHSDVNVCKETKSIRVPEGL